jgi:hypothetical protein
MARRLANAAHGARWAGVPALWGLVPYRREALQPLFYCSALRRHDRHGLPQYAGCCQLQPLTRRWRLVNVNDLGAAVSGLGAPNDFSREVVSTWTYPPGHVISAQ